MNPTTGRFLSVIKRFPQRRGMIFGGMLLLALLAFEIFNYSTTAFALTDMLGTNLGFLGISWATMLSIAFCGIDFAGIARLFTPEQGRDRPAETWYLFGAWLLAACMNAMLTWWGVSVAVRNHQELSALVVGQSTLIKVVPVFVALMVWLMRVLIIGTFSAAGERLFSLAEFHPAVEGNAIRYQPARPLASIPNTPKMARPSASPFRPKPRPEPNYHPTTSMAASPRNANSNVRK